jgi:hypothetical protein
MRALNRAMGRSDPVSGFEVSYLLLCTTGMVKGRKNPVSRDVFCTYIPALRIKSYYLTV